MKKIRETFDMGDREELVEIGKQLCILKPEDIRFILNEKNSETEVRQRFTAARLR